MFYLELLVVVAAVVGCLAVTQRKRRQLQERRVLLDPLKNHFSKSDGEDLSIHQHILKLSGHRSLRYLCGIITLRREFCLSHLISGHSSENVIFTGELMERTPCVYIFRKNILLRHYGLNYAKRYLLANIPEYKIFGNAEEKHVEFVRRHRISVFFVSYVPTTVGESQGMRTRVFLKGDLGVLDNKGFVDDFMALFDEVSNESAKRASEIEHGWRKDVEALRTSENRSFGEKVISQMREKNKGRKRRK